MLGFLKRLLSPVQGSVAKSGKLPGVELYLERRLPQGESVLVCIRISPPFALGPLDDDLERLGWERAALDRATAEDKLQVVYSKNGSGFFGDWTKNERRNNMRELHDVLRKHGFYRVPIHGCPAAI